jgi:hypothetical protein
VLGCVEHGNEILGYLKCGHFFKEILATQEGLCSKELFG